MEGILAVIFSGMYLLFWLAGYVWLALCLHIIANKTNTPNGWLAWIPIANVFLMFSIAGMSFWWILLLFVPIANIVLALIVWMKIAEARKQPSWLGILMIIPGANLVIPGVLAFSD